MHRYHALIEEGRHKDARRIAEEYALVESKIENMARLAERQDG
jgi:hypothetical protein